MDPGESLNSCPTGMVALIGIDCATQPRKVGLALAELDGEIIRIKACRTASPREEPAWIVSRWMADHGTALLALDAPLGWPRAMGEALSTHQAGAGIGAATHELFRRQTDDAIHQRFNKRPLEVEPTSSHGRPWQRSTCWTNCG